MRLTRVALAAVLSLGIAACGGDEKPEARPKAKPEPTSAFGKLSVVEIRNAVATDMEGLSSVHVVGTFEGDGESFDLRLDNAGNCTGKLTNSGGSAEVIDSAMGHLVRADRGYWDAYAGDRAQVLPDDQLDKWIYTPLSLGFFTPACEWGWLVPQLALGDPARSEIGVEDEINGEPVIALQDLDGRSTMWVKIEVPHYVIRLDTTGDEAGQLDLDEFNEPVVLPEPDPSEVINPGDLSKKAE